MFCFHRSSTTVCVAVLGKLILLRVRLSPAPWFVTLLTRYGVNFVWVLYIPFKSICIYFSLLQIKNLCSSIGRVIGNLSTVYWFESYLVPFSFALFYHIFPKIRPILFKESWFINFCQLLPSRAIFWQNNWATADILYIVPLMSNFVKFFGSLLKTALLLYKCCDFRAKTDFWVLIFHNPSDHSGM